MTNREIAQQVAAMRERLAGLCDRIQAEPMSNTSLQTEIVEELQSTLNILQTAQSTILQQAELSEQALIQESSQTLREAQLQESLQESKLLLREIHHRVKNNLQIVSSLLDLQVMQTSDPYLRDLLRNNQSRINLVALVHESLSQSANLTVIDFSDYIRSLATTVFRIYAINAESVNLRIELMANLSIHLDKAIPVGLILNELLSNALKYCFRSASVSEVVVSLEVNRQEQITLAVSNSGDTLPPNFDLNRVESLGLQLVSALVRQIDGVLEVTQRNPTVFSVTFDNSQQDKKSITTML